MKRKDDAIITSRTNRPKQKDRHVLSYNVTTDYGLYAPIIIIFYNVQKASRRKQGAVHDGSVGVHFRIRKNNDDRSSSSAAAG